MTAREKPYAGRGLAGIVDKLVGRIEDCGRPSFGATVMLICIIPSFILILTVSFSVAYTSVFTPASIEKAKAIKKTRVSRVSRTTTTRTQVGWPIVALCGATMGLGVLIHLSRKKSDRLAAIQIGETVSKIKNGASPTDFSEVMKHVSPVIDKVKDNVSGVGDI
ncbi:MAG: hypothetical protein KKB59_20165 [Spirochaetes bacterium]|nr:hypothetical protein [Spirochaetota bacterium]